MQQLAHWSKALNGHNDQSGYQQVAREAGRSLHAKPALMALKRIRTYNLGVLFGWTRRSGLTRVLRGCSDSFKRHAEGAGYDITFINHNITAATQLFRALRATAAPDGVIAACIKFDDPEVIELANSNLPIVTVDHVFNNRAAAFSDNTDGNHVMDQLAASA